MNMDYKDNYCYKCGNHFDCPCNSWQVNKRETEWNKFKEALEKIVENSSCCVECSASYYAKEALKNE